MRLNSRAHRIVLGLVLVVTLGLITGLIIGGCKIQTRYRDTSGYSPPREAARPSPPMANGGLVPPNDAAYDAMFFESRGVNPFIDTEDDRLSTFGVDVDTASYTISRAYLKDGHLPPKEAVRVEEFVNFFNYDYPAPGEGAFRVVLEGAPSRFGGGRYHLVRIGIKGREIGLDQRKPAVLTFVIDVSGSMDREDRLELVKRSLRRLVDQLRPEDQVGIVVYGSEARIILEHRALEHRREILSAIDRLGPDGSTNAEQGLRLGYQLAAQAFKPGAVNRVILCSDGVANMGETGAEGILAKIKGDAAKGITLSAIGFGMGNYNDALMEQLADQGDGNYYYVDSEDESRRVFMENLSGMLQVIAKDVKVQVDFNPEVVSRYRLLGYENRAMADRDFRNDRVDGGEIGAGHQVTALYELKLQKDAPRGPVVSVAVRYRDPARQERVVEVVEALGLAQLPADFDQASPGLRLAAAVAEFSEILRQSYWAQDRELREVAKVIRDLPEEDRSRPEVLELQDLVAKANSMLKTRVAARDPDQED